MFKVTIVNVICDKRSVIATFFADHWSSFYIEDIVLRLILRAELSSAMFIIFDPILS